MVVKVVLHGEFRFGRFPNKKMEIPENCDVDWILSTLNIPPEETAIILVNGQSSSRKTILHDGDALLLSPPVGGG